jgi:chaperonin GroEL
MLEKITPKTEVAEKALEIIKKIAVAPITAIIENSGENATTLIDEIVAAKGGVKDKTEKLWLGFNASTNEIMDLRKAGIIDPLKVTKTAFLNAVSAATNYLTIGGAVADIPKVEKEEGGHNHGMY